MLYDAREEYLDAKRQFEECRDGWIPHLDQSDEEHAKELVQLMHYMDSCEADYHRAVEERDQMSIEDMHIGNDSALYEEIMGHPWEEKDLPALIREANLARLEYEEMLREGKDEYMTDDEYESELQRLHFRWELAEADCWYVHSREQREIEEEHRMDYYEQLAF